MRKPVLTTEQDGRTLVQRQEIEGVHKIVPQSGVHCLRILLPFQSIFVNPDQLFAAAGVLSKNIVGDAVKPRREPGFSTKAANMSIGPQKRLLRKIVRQAEIGPGKLA